MKLGIVYGGVKDESQYSYLMFFVQLLDQLILSIGKLLALFNTKKSDETVTEEATTAAPVEGE